MVSVLVLEGMHTNITLDFFLKNESTYTKLEIRLSYLIRLTSKLPGLWQSCYMSSVGKAEHLRLQQQQRESRKNIIYVIKIVIESHRNILYF